jgi:hypothetical protein
MPSVTFGSVWPHCAITYGGLSPPTNSREEYVRLSEWGVRPERRGSRFLVVTRSTREFWDGPAQLARWKSSLGRAEGATKGPVDAHRQLHRHTATHVGANAPPSESGERG